MRGEAASVGAPGCARCGAPLGSRWAFWFPTPGGAVAKCLGCALRHGPLVRRSATIALVVGTLLVAINQGDLLFQGRWSGALLWKIPLTYLVPFGVATWGALVNTRAPDR